MAGDISPRVRLSESLSESLLGGIVLGDERLVPGQLNCGLLTGSRVLAGNGFQTAAHAGQLSDDVR